MAEGILNLPLAVAPKRVLQWMQDLRASTDRLRPEGVGIGGVEMEHDRRTTGGLRRSNVHFGELIREPHRMICVPLASGTSSPPSAFVYHPTARAASRTTRCDVIVSRLAIMPYYRS